FPSLVEQLAADHLVTKDLERALPLRLRLEDPHVLAGERDERVDGVFLALGHLIDPDAIEDQRRVRAVPVVTLREGAILAGKERKQSRPPRGSDIGFAPCCSR